MKKFFLISLMTLVCSVMAWAETVQVSTNAELVAAISNADADVIQLTDDIDDATSYIITRSLTLDLQNHTITQPTANSSQYVFNVNASGIEVTIQNGAVVRESYKYNTNQAGFNIWINQAAEVTLTNVTATGGYRTLPIYNTNCNIHIQGGLYRGVQMALLAYSGTIQIDGGTFEATQSGQAYAIYVTPYYNNVNLTVTDGIFSAAQNAVCLLGRDNKTINMTVSGGEFTSTGSSNCMELDGNYSSGDANRASYPVVLTITGGTFNGATGIGLYGKGTELNMQGGTVTGSGYGISGNGTAKYAGTTINISGGTIAQDPTVKSAAIYHPQSGTLNISGSTYITGHTCIQLCSGIGLTGSITGGRFEAYGYDERPEKTGDGTVADGAALSIVNRDYPGGTPMFSVNGGVFLAQHQNAVLAYTWSSNTASEWEGATNYLSIREGIFSSNPSAYVPADGYEFTQLDPTPTVYNHDEVVYNEIWQVQEADHIQSYDFTSANAEYVEIGTSTESDNVDHGNKEYTLNEDQNSKKVEVIEEYTLIVKEDNTLNIGGGGLILEDNAQMVVEPGAVVTVGTNGIINPNGTENLVLESTDEKQAVLMIDPDVVQNTQPQATVKLITKAKQKRGTTADPVYEYIWDYFASPVVEITDFNKPTNDFDEAVHGLYTEQASFISGVYTWGGNDWQFVDSWKSLVPFKGYQLTNNTANGGVEYTFKGNLLGNEDGEYAFTSNGYGYFGNSYTAPIVISNFLSALDNAVYERTVWLYDAGADSYVSVNPLAARLGSAKYKDGTKIKEIRSLQAFILNKKADGANAQINYRDAIWNNPRINSLASPAPARREADEMLWTNIYVAANGNKEMVTLVEGVDFSSEFDNGADAGKYINNNGMNLYAATNDGEQAIVATDNLENTLISFQAGNATEYTLSFENGNENYMLRDNVTNETIAMVEGATYTFSQAANTNVPARFEIIGAHKVPTAIDNVEESAKAMGIYTLTGQFVGRDFTKLPAGVYVVNGVKIVK